jgi:hypothetical protein
MSAADHVERYSCEHVVAIEQEPRHHLIIENEFVRAFAVEIAPHDRTLCHHHAHDYLLYVDGIADIVSAPRNEAPKTILYKDGECERGSAGMIHVVENLGDQPFRNVVVELLPGCGELRRGASPRPGSVGGIARVAALLDEEAGSIFRIRMTPEAEVEVFGPAIVAAPRRHRLNPEAPGDVVIKPNEVCDLAWVPPGRTALLWGCREQTEQAIVFQVGQREGEGLALPGIGEPRKSLHAHAARPKDEPE